MANILKSLFLRLLLWSLEPSGENETSAAVNLRSPGVGLPKGGVTIPTLAMSLVEPKGDSGKPSTTMEGIASIHG
jgi:hypothetical protein